MKRIVGRHREIPTKMVSTPDAQHYSAQGQIPETVITIKTVKLLLQQAGQLNKP
jgi:hypothetical protein